MAKSAVGVELNAKYIRAVHLKRVRRGVVIGGFSTVDHEGAVSAHRGVEDVDQFRKAFKQALSDAGATRENICMACDYADVDVRELEFPVMPEKDLLQSIRFELSNVVRFRVHDADELDFDYVPLPGDQAGGRRRILSMAAPRSVSISVLDPLHRDGIFPEVLEFGAFGLPWACPREGGVCYIHTTQKSLHILLYEGKEFRMSRQVGVDLSGLIDETDAEDGQDTGDAEMGVNVKEIVTAVQRTFEFYRARRRAADISEIVKILIVSGEATRSKQLLPQISKEVGLPAIAADPIIGPGDEGRFGVEAPRYAVACGIGMRGLETL